MALILLGSIFASLLTRYDPTAINTQEALQGISASHPLGTDYLGRDLLARVLYGGRVSVLTAVAATALSMLLGLIIGLLAGYYGGILDSIITCFTSIFRGFPAPV